MHRVPGRSAGAAGVRGLSLRRRNQKILYAEDGEIFENWIEGSVDVISGIPVVSADGLIRMKRKLGREKDLADIALIKKALETDRP